MTHFNNVINTVFPTGIPEVSKWTNHIEIIKLLNTIGSFENSNHLFYPKGGGLDLRGASVSHETNCIEIRTSFNEVISPINVTFNSFENDENNEWAYFRIEINELTKTNVYNNDVGFDEELTELSPLNYVSREHWDENEYNGKSLPTGTRLVIRRLKGSMVIFGKSSPYNKHSSTYDGRHNQYNEDEFRNYIKQVKTKGWDK